MWNSVREAPGVGRNMACDEGSGRRPEQMEVGSVKGRDPSLEGRGRSPKALNGREFLVYSKRNGKPVLYLFQ